MISYDYSHDYRKKLQYQYHSENLPKKKKKKVCFVVCDNGFSQIFYNCSKVEEIFSWHN